MISTIFFGLFGLHSSVQIVGLLVTAVMLGCAVQEAITGKYRDWVHVLGIGTTAFAFVVSSFWQVAMMIGLFGST